METHLNLNEFDLDVKIEVTSIQELREVRKEIERIAEIQKEMKEDKEKDYSFGDDDDLDIDIPTPEYPKDPGRPKHPDLPGQDTPYFMSGNQAELDVNIDSGLDEFRASGAPQNGMSDEEFHEVGQIEEEKLNDGHL